MNLNWTKYFAQHVKWQVKVNCCFQLSSKVKKTITAYVKEGFSNWKKSPEKITLYEKYACYSRHSFSF